MFMYGSPVSSSQNNKILLPQALQTLGTIGLHLKLLHIHHCCHNPRVVPGEREECLCPIHSQVGPKQPSGWEQHRAVLSWANCCYCTSYKENPSVLCENAGRERLHPASESFCPLLHSSSPAALRFPCRCNRAPKLNC